MAEGLTEFIARTIHLPFVWGVRDCTLWAADWCVEAFGFDPAADLRGFYATEEDVQDLTGGDLAGFVAPRMARLTRVDQEACCGDVGIIDVSGQQVAAIRRGAFWLIKTERGGAALRAQAVMAWGSPCLR
ncbi:DUF6950 family protein [Palleronia caenipelagi]|uniref:DUF6950 domain-containing protein n=1 Tax=Palleronia caenipelagi TaxID=2489174 RepID=A0A547Q6A1_9RHOB|nr:hypothetical protein [Palleronia caenipelagi]TRD21916.1 hypothetical protein FEV53_07655 [Palleronia caenipelagi]